MLLRSTTSEVDEDQVERGVIEGVGMRGGGTWRGRVGRMRDSCPGPRDTCVGVSRTKACAVAPLPGGDMYEAVDALSLDQPLVAGGGGGARGRISCGPWSGLFFLCPPCLTIRAPPSGAAPAVGPV